MDNTGYFLSYLNYLAATAGWVAFLLYFGAITINLVLINVAAKAARRKNRSYGAFWWLGLTLTPVVTFIIVALLPFNEYDPRAPFTRLNSESHQELAWINNYVKEPTLSKSDRGWLIAGGIAFVLGFFLALAALSAVLSGSYY